MNAPNGLSKAHPMATRRIRSGAVLLLQMTRTQRDFAVLAVITALTVITERRTDVIGWLLQTARNRNSALTNALLELMLVLVLVFAIFAWRRWSDLRWANRRRIAAEAQQQASAAQYQMHFEANPQPMWVFDETTLAFLAVNDAAIAHYGYSRDAFLAMTINDLRLPAEAAELHEYLAHQSGEYRRAGVWRHQKKDGTAISVEISSHRVIFAGHAAHLILAADVTEQMRGEAAVRESDARKGAILEAALDCIISIDHTGAIMRITMASHATSRTIWAARSTSGWSSPLSVPTGVNSPWN
ncbi:MAG: PAS domain S-box protein [Thermomicrobia bacterium]|nr:PAS domain S-box protein [Thermomicrobia bacterium]